MILNAELWYVPVFLASPSTNTCVWDPNEANRDEDRFTIIQKEIQKPNQP